MSPERYKLVEQLFHAALAIDPAERRGFVDGRCAHDPELHTRLLSLLDHHDAGGVEPNGEFADALRAVTDAALRHSLPAAHPTHIASYRIIRPLGEGGFGIVYLAEQERPRRTVALKLLRAPFSSGEIARRFEYEARILARLRHPGIAQIYEAGAAEVRLGDNDAAVMRQPFLALEYVDGPNLVNFALGRRPASSPLPIRERLSLFSLVCDALHHAHQHGVIHRDLKPDNILVACDDAPRPPSGAPSGGDRSPFHQHLAATPAPQPKLLDFGVARVLDAEPDLTRVHTAAGRMIGTLAYMSPEQVGAESHSIDTRSDIYTMGVLLYQLLSGDLPYDVSDTPLDHAVRIIRERNPQPIRTLDRAIRDDAHAVIQKAMAKDRDRRYTSVAEFAADIRRLLAGEPVAAKADSRWYVISKTMRRHRLPLGVAAAFVLLLASSSVAGWMLFASAQRERAHSASLLRESYLNQARAVRASNAVGRRFVAADFLKKAAALRMGDDLRSEAIAALCLSDFRPTHSFPKPTSSYASARGLARLDRMAFVDPDGHIRIREVDSGREIRVIPPRNAPPIRIRFDTSGDYLGAHYIADGKTTIVIWAVDTPQPLFFRTVSGPTDFTFGATGHRQWVALPRPTDPLAAGDATAGSAKQKRPRGLDIVALPSGELISSLATGGDSLFMAASPDGARLALVAPGGDSLTLVDSSTGLQLASWKSKPILRSPAWSPDSGLLGAAGDDARVHLWDPLTLQPLPPLEGHRATVSDLIIHLDLIASAGWDGSVRIWDRATRSELLAPLLGAELLGFDGSRLAVADADDFRVLEFDAESPRRVLRAPAPLGAEATIDFSPDSSLIAVAGAHGVHAWDTRTLHRTTLTSRAARSIMIVPGERPALIAIADNALVRWDLRATRSPIPPAPEPLHPSGPYEWASLHPDAERIIFSHHGDILSFDLNRRHTTTLATAAANTERPITDASSRWLFLGTWRGDPARVIDLRAGDAAHTFTDSSVRGSFSPDGRFLAVGLPGRHLIYQSGHWNSPREFPSREADLSSIAGGAAISSDNHLFAYVEPPHVVRLADLSTGAVIATLPNPARHGVPALRFSADDQFLAVPTLDDTIFLWNMTHLRAELQRMGLGW